MEFWRIWDKTWKDRRGRIVIWQTPNAYLWSWLGLTFLSLFFVGTSAIANILTGAASIALIVWAFLEITKGVNYFRRALGVVVLIWSVLALIKSFS